MILPSARCNTIQSTLRACCQSGVGKKIPATVEAVCVFLDPILAFAPVNDKAMEPPFPQPVSICRHQLLWVDPIWDACSDTADDWDTESQGGIDDDEDGEYSGEDEDDQDEEYRDAADDSHSARDADESDSESSYSQEGLMSGHDDMEQDPALDDNWTRGGNVKLRATRQRSLPWTTGVHYQRLFPSRRASRCFEVS
ncbi:hypothetical protein B0J13DRAFT_579050, partial [Dactylonectria estremocensis]